MIGREAFQAKEDRLKALLLEGLAGNAPAYQSFLKELSAHLRSFLRKRLARLPEEVEDLVQESLLAIHNQRHTYDPSQPLSAWVQAIARYKLVDLLRRKSAKDMLTDPLDEESEIFANCRTNTGFRSFTSSWTACRSKKPLKKPACQSPPSKSEFIAA